MHVTVEQQWEDIVSQWRELIAQKLSSEKVTRAELARRVGLSAQNVTTYLNGHGSPSPQMMDRFLKALGVEHTFRVRETETSNA